MDPVPLYAVCVSLLLMAVVADPQGRVDPHIQSPSESTSSPTGRPDAPGVLRGGWSLTHIRVSVGRPVGSPSHASRRQLTGTGPLNAG